MTITGGGAPGAPELTPAQEKAMEDRIDAVRRAVKAGRPESGGRGAGGRAPEEERREFEKDQLQGRSAEPGANHTWDNHKWRSVMEAHGFTWYSPAALDIRVGFEKIIPAGAARAGYHVLRPHREGQWRNDIGTNVPTALRAAFTSKDLISGFQTPETFDEWIRDRKMRFAAARAGLVLPR